MQNKHQHGLYPGSFDPITYGHIDIVCRFATFFKKITVLVASSIHKKYWFSLKERYAMAHHALKKYPKIQVDQHKGLTTKYMQKHNIHIVLRGLRSVSDFAYERDLALNNKKIFPKMETLFLFSNPKQELISARWIKEIAYHKGNLKNLVPSYVENKIKQHALKGENS